MNNYFIKLLLGLMSISSLFAKRYDNYKVFTTENIESIETQRNIVSFVENDETCSFDFWKKPTPHDSSVSITVKPGSEKVFKKMLESQNVQFNETISNIQRIFDSESTHNRKEINAKFSFQGYYGHYEINEFLEKMAKKYCQFVNIIDIGKSSEGREMKVLKIEKAGTKNPTMFIEAGIHAREWISPAMAAYLIYALLEKPENSNYLNLVNFHILPVANPDGYEYSRTSDRMWRKTRSYNSDSNCRGVDANRNWDYQWGTTGISSNECSQVYPGKTPFSEVETRNIRDYIMNLSKRPYMAFVIHSAANLLLYPYGYQTNTFPDNVNEIRTLGQKFVENLNKVHGQNFMLMNSADLYPASGASDDYYSGVLGIRYSYTLELRKGSGFNTFELPVAEIIPSGEELFEGFKVFIEAGKKL